MRIDERRLQECSDRCMDWLHQCWIPIHNKEPEKLVPDPFYERNDVLTPEIVKKVIDDIEAIFVKELDKYMGYHRNAQGVSESQVLVTPSFDTLPYLAQRCIVQGLDRIMQDYRDDSPPVTYATGVSPPEYYDGC